RVGDLSLDRIPREFRVGAFDFEATLLADGAAATVAPHEPTRANALLAGHDGDLLVRSLEAFDCMAALDLDSERECAIGEDALEMLRVTTELGAGWTWEPVRPPTRIDVAVFERDAREVAGWPAGRRSERRGSDLFQQPAPVERFDAWAPEP